MPEVTVAGAETGEPRAAGPAAPAAHEPALAAERHYREAFDAFERDGARNGIAWLAALRRAAMARLTERGFPRPRDEEWRFTDLSAVLGTAFARPAGRAPALPAAELAPFEFPGLAASSLVFVDGRFAPELSALGALPSGVVVKSLARALVENGPTLESALGRYADPDRDAFLALNTAFLEDGAFVAVPRGVALAEPIRLLYLSTAAASPRVTHPRTLILAGERSQGVVLEDYVSLGEGARFTNAVTELVAEPGAVWSHYRLVRESPEAVHISTLRIQQGRDTDVTAHAVLLGGALVRDNVHPVLSGEGAHCLVNRLFLARGRQHRDNTMRVEHVRPHGASRQFYHGILDEQSRGVFHGRILVHPGAQHTDAKQTNRNLLLAEGAQMDTKPQLEIHADDVKCTHGATIGQLEEDAVFYLRARGIGAREARAMLILAFARESLGRMKLAPVREKLEEAVAEWLSQGSRKESSWARSAT